MTFAVTKHHQHSNLGEKRVYLAHSFTSLFIIEGTQDRNSNRTETWRQELRLRSWRSEALWLASHGLLSLFAYRTQGHQTKGGATTYQTAIKQMFCRLAYSLLLWRHFLNGGFLISDDYSLCQVVIKLVGILLSMYCFSQVFITEAKPTNIANELRDISKTKFNVILCPSSDSALEVLLYLIHPPLP